MKSRSKSLLCRLRMYSWFRDSANYCNRCGCYQSVVDQERLEFERSLWESEVAETPGDIIEAGARILTQLAHR